jgi:hypothetical protein
MQASVPKKAQELRGGKRGEPLAAAAAYNLALARLQLRAFFIALASHGARVGFGCKGARGGGGGGEGAVR